MSSIACYSQLFAQLKCSAAFGRPFPLFIAFVLKQVKLGGSKEFTLKVSVYIMMSYAIESFVHEDNVSFAPSTFHRKIVGHDPLFSTI